MPSVLPDGDPAPADGLLPASCAHEAQERTMSFYVHIPFCTVRCGYCDFNTYTATELGSGSSQATYAATVSKEISFAREVMDRSGQPDREIETVFFGGGTPTLLPAGDLVSVLGRIRDEFGLKPGAEITTEANPDSVTRESLQELADGGFTRVSFGMQSAVPHVLKVLERTHDPMRVPQAVAWAREAGLDVSVDLIYGTPGESLEDWRTSIEAALSYEPDHISAYALIIEEGTKLAAQIRRGQVPNIDDDDHAEKYQMADEMFAAAGFSWYEVSNWAKTPANACQHNIAYWKGGDWWGAGPGAHSHVGGLRWWNVKHPAAYQQRIDAGISPGHGREYPDAQAVQLERTMLLTRLSSGMQISELDETGRKKIAGLIADELIDAKAAFSGTLVLTQRGRLLADLVVRELLDF
ncbi:radical SAM family heme chaperone HemW [Glutamicibacter mysorens]|uniref:radical SAM family heme chaperone HemW n=1 Tax=Glutamicibacter mysorens TaxID=257984 RepID=UPI0020C5EA8C|nr:radical SAM family heme chaperone HemW [Glutamicibacter mysorens]UTM47290.1 radical SAM family heme chaperone HemW [Glutamicibacter mysorens]